MSLSPTYKNIILDSLPNTLYVAIHRGFPATLANEITASGRKMVTLAAAVDGVRSLSGSPPFCTWNVAQGETIASIGYWDTQTSGQGTLVWDDDIVDEAYDEQAGKADLNGGDVGLSDLT